MNAKKILMRTLPLAAIILLIVAVAVEVLGKNAETLTTGSNLRASNCPFGASIRVVWGLQTMCLGALNGESCTLVHDTLNCGSFGLQLRPRWCLTAAQLLAN